MRTRHIIQALFLSLFFAACARPVEMRHGTSLPTDMSPELSAIDSLMWQWPDSALTCLLPYFDTCCRDGVHTVSTTHDCHYANLLLAELLYKNDNPQLNRAELLRAVDYYDSLYACTDVARNVSTNAFLDARVHYINGVGYYERDSVVEACQEYLKALEVMEERFEEKELVGDKAHFIALIYTHLTDLFSDLYLHEQALYFGKRALDYYLRYNATPWHIAWVLEEIGSHYNMMGNYDSADYYYQKSLASLPDTNNLTYRDIATHLAYLSYKKDGATQRALKQLCYQLSKAESEKEYSSRCLIIGTVFYHESLFDSAAFYMNRVYETTNSLDSKLFTAQKLLEINQKDGDSVSNNKFSVFLSKYAGPKDQHGELDSKLTELYHGYVQNRQETLLHRKLRTQKNWTWGILGFFAFFGCVFMIFYFVNKKQHRRLRIQNEESHQQLIQHTATIGKLKRTMLRLQTENKKLNERIEHTDMIQEKNYKVRIEEYTALLNENICLNIKLRLKKAQAYSSFDVKDYASMALSSKEMGELIQAIDQHCPDFSKKINHAYPNLSIKDLQLCRLFLLDLSVLQVTILLGTDYSSIRKRANRLKQKTGGEELCHNLKTFLFEE